MIATLSASPQHETPSLLPGWDSHVFALRGDDREHLRSRAARLIHFLERQPGASAFHLAATLARQFQPEGVCLAIVASSIPDLTAKLHRACDRLGDSKCKQIRNAAGTYFSSQPLFHEGKLALLFPGEAAQYPGMMADLCSIFPEVEETFAWTDRIAEEFGNPEESLRKILHVPAEASAEQRLAAETQLRRLGPSIFSVLIGDLAIARILENLQLPVSAVAGHSAGELAALVAAGAIRKDALLGDKLGAIMAMMQQQEDEAGGPDVALLAIGTGKGAVLEIASAIGGDSVHIAMDNCPHQCVAVGPSELVAKIESVLLERGLVCERLPFRRPYHTPLFEPWMGPYRELFADIPFESPHTPIYSCSTGALFPANQDAIRNLTVNHWVSPVEFTRLIEGMYADGIRLFVESGPRGNLAAFAEDILRGRPFAAIPANVARKSGPTQINHLVAQMLVHQVPVNLDHLFRGTAVPPIEWDARTAPRANNSPESYQNGNGADDFGLRDAVTQAIDGVPRVEVVNGYLNVMEQFLDVQRSVMEAFLKGDPDAVTALQLDDFALPDFVAYETPSASIPHSPVPEQHPQYAMIGQIEHYEAGRTIVARRMLDEREDLFADHHTLAGRGVSRVNPGQNGLPVLPMTFSIEAMAEAAALLAPGKVVVTVRNIRLFRWVPFDPEPTVFEIRASVTTVDPETGQVEVKADVRDLGNSFVKDGANKVAAEAIIVLADQYPDRPEPLAFQLTNEQPCRTTIEMLRRNMFHGPLFQMIRQLGRQGKEGIEGTLEVQSREKWFRSNSDPAIVLDPVLIDAGMHIFGAWHLDQPDWTGRILLPFEVQRIEFFGPNPAVGTQLIVRGRNEQESARHFRHGMEILDQNGRPWLRMTGAGYWRFYLPFGGHVNFFGPKDEYFLSRDWPQAVLPRQDGLPRRCYYLDPPVDLKQPVLRAAGVRVTMTPRELEQFRTWKGSDDDLNAWFFGRLVAKDAVRAAWMEKHGAATFPADIESELVNGRIVCRPRGEEGPEPLPPVSVVIAGGRVAAFSAFASQVGLALIPVSKGEKESDIRARVACLAVADAIGITLEQLSPNADNRDLGEFGVTVSTQAAEQFPTYAGRSIRVQTACDKDFIVATTLCEVCQ